jgi:hypothetical protein
MSAEEAVARPVYLEEARCSCAECTEHGGPDPRIMVVKFTVLAAQFAVALAGMIRERSWKALGVFLSALAFFFTVPRYLICTRCPGYGKNCYPFYLGRITSAYLPGVEGKTVGPGGAGLELVTLSTLSLAPVFGLWRTRKLPLYLLLANLTAALHFGHACRHCAKYATDWRKDCHLARIARKVFSQEL